MIRGGAPRPRNHSARQDQHPGSIPVDIETQRIPLLPWLSHYRLNSVRADLLAGIATAAVVLPQAMAYATIAGVPVQYGLYVATIPMLVYAVLGTSRPLSVSTTSTVAALTATAVVDSSGGGSANAITAATTLAVLAGVVLLVAGIFKLGFVADFISAPVLAGFKIGTALVIIAGQLGKVLGVSVTGESFFEKTWSAIAKLPDANSPTVMLSLLTIAGLLILRRLMPRVPGALVAVAAGIIAVEVLGLAERGVVLVPKVPSGLPGPVMPDMALIGGLFPAACGIALMTFVESIASARTFQRAQDVPLSPDRELIALGAAGSVGGVFQAIPAAGGLSQTAVNAGNGARSPMAGAVTGLFGIVTLLFLTPLFADLAEATLGAIVLVAVLGLLDTSALRSIGRIRRRDVWLGVIAIVGILLFGVLGGVLIAVILSVLVLIHGVNVMPIRILGLEQSGRFVDTGRAGEALADILIVRPEGGIYFGNIGRICARVEYFLSLKPEVRTLVIDASAIPDIEITGALGLGALEKRLGDRGIELWIASPTPRAGRMVQTALSPEGRARVQPTIEDVIQASRVQPPDNPH